MDQARIADCINRLGDFCALQGPARPDGSGAAGAGRAGERADLMILFGACIPAGMDLVAQAYRGRDRPPPDAGGRRGHTTAALREAVNAALPADRHRRAQGERGHGRVPASALGLTDLPLGATPPTAATASPLALEQMARMTPPPPPGAHRAGRHHAAAHGRGLSQVRPRSSG